MLKSPALYGYFRWPFFQLVEYDRAPGRISSTELGRIAYFHMVYIVGLGALPRICLIQRLQTSSSKFLPFKLLFSSFFSQVRQEEELESTRTPANSCQGKCRTRCEHQCIAPSVYITTQTSRYGFRTTIRWTVSLFKLQLTSL